jgi:hypothetical protein
MIAKLRCTNPNIVGVKGHTLVFQSVNIRKCNLFVTRIDFSEVVNEFLYFYVIKKTRLAKMY